LHQWLLFSPPATKFYDIFQLGPQNNSSYRLERRLQTEFAAALPRPGSFVVSAALYPYAAGRCFQVNPVKEIVMRAAPVWSLLFGLMISLGGIFAYQSARADDDDEEECVHCCCPYCDGCDPRKCDCPQCDCCNE
jgi:hypothetical protein